MRTRTNLYLAGLFFLIAIALFVLIATHKTKAVSEVTATDSNNTVARYIDEAEKQDALERDQREQTNKLTKLAKAKKDSVECQFWTLQKQKKSTNPRIDEKITQFCELPPEQAATLTSANETSSQPKP